MYSKQDVILNRVALENKIPLHPCETGFIIAAEYWTHRSNMSRLFY